MFIITPMVVLLAVTSNWAQAALVGATVYDGKHGVLQDAAILVENGMITAIGSDVELPANAEIMDVTAKFIMPGMVDAHVHFFQTGFFDSRPDAADLREDFPYDELYEQQKNHPDKYYESYLRSGVTAVYDVGGFAWSVGLQEKAEDNLDAPHVAASGILLTPFPAEYLATFNTETDTVIMPIRTVENAKRVVREMTALGSTGIKIWGIPDEDTGSWAQLQEISQEIRRLGNKMIVHATTHEGAKWALQIEAKLLVHSVADILVDDAFIERLLENETIYCPTMIVGYGYGDAYRALLGWDFEIDDPYGVVDDQTAEIMRNAHSHLHLVDSTNIANRFGQPPTVQAGERGTMANNLFRIYRKGGLIAVGTDAGNPGTLHGISYIEELEAMQRTGIQPPDLIVMATRNGALAMDRLDDFGTLEVGKMADLIIMDDDPGQDISNIRSISHVMRGGLLRSVKKPFNK